MEVSDTLAALAQRVPLPSHWSNPECYSESVQVHGLQLDLVGLLARTSDGRDVSGSAAGQLENALERAYFELLERAVLLDALHQETSTFSVVDANGDLIERRARELVFPRSPEDADWVYARSNGVAAGVDLPSACGAARAELIERHAVLSSWFGWTAPCLVESPQGLEELDASYQFETHHFPHEGEKIQVVGVFGFPRTNSVPLVYGFGADLGFELAALRAQRECLQRLGFLWGESIPTEEPPFQPSADYHQELYLWPAMHEALRGWLAGKHVGKTLPRRFRDSGGYVDLTPPELSQRVRVVKALSQTELPLTFGRGHPALQGADGLLGVHPIV